MCAGGGCECGGEGYGVKGQNIKFEMIVVDKIKVGVLMVEEIKGLEETIAGGNNGGRDKGEVNWIRRAMTVGRRQGRNVSAMVCSS